MAGPGAPHGGTPTVPGPTGPNRSHPAQATGSLGDVTESCEIWEFWWENNKDQYLDLKSRLSHGVILSGTPSVLTGVGRSSDALSTSRASQQVIESVVIPSLIQLLHQSDNQDILDSAVLALGRTARGETADQMIDAVQPLLAHKELSVQTAATLSLGVLGSPKAVPVLTELMTNSSRGQQLAGGGDVHWLMRAFAALSLGLINDGSSVEPLINIIQNTRDSEHDLKACAIVALGLMDNDEVRKAYEFLMKELDDRELDAVVKSYIPTTLAKMGHGTRIEAKGALLKTFLDKDVDNDVRQSAAIALGLLGNMTDKDLVDGLLQYVAEGKDMQTRHFGFIALAEIGKRDKDTEAANAATHQKITELFAREIVKPSIRTNRSWAALAGAIYAKDIVSAAPVLIEQLSRAYKSEKDPSFKSAFALALGLLNVQPMAETIHEDFRESKDEGFRGYAAVALGFLNCTQAADDLRGLCQDKTIAPTFRLQVATGLGLMKDTEAVKVLVSTLKDAQTLGVSSAVAKALGIIGDEKAIEPLKEIAFDASVQNITRAFACVALGMVCEKTDLPWNARISQDNNYRARVPAIDEVLDIL
ncbi:MAG TPA: HEAT repeat domain-containing protein [Planctomycetota bacterium]|nr:HEAT repeat domain-containing protein [Planctomycetota bacterium]